MLNLTIKFNSFHIGVCDAATGKTVTWNLTATEVDVDSEKSEKKNEETVNTGYYNIFNVTDMDEIATIAVNHKLYCELANVGAGIDGGFENTQELCVMTYQEAINVIARKKKTTSSITWPKTKCLKLCLRQIFHLEPRSLTVCG